MEFFITEAKHSEACSWHQDWHNCNCILFNTVLYPEQDESESNVVMFLSVEDAINKQIAHAKFFGKGYLSQDEALQDFLALHWAWIE